MAKIYKTSDRIKLQIDDLVVKISPLTFEQKMQVQSLVLKGGAESAMRAAKLACQFAIKDIDGIEAADGSKYELVMEDGLLSDETWDDLQNLQESQRLVAVSLALINGVPSDFVDPETGKKLEGVKIIKEEPKGKKK